jgi:prepilin-type N-terminal cleavage/methylation domain-containing protein
MKPLNVFRLRTRRQPGHPDPVPAGERPRARRGFTLIEFIGVLAIIAILAAAGIESVIGNMTSSQVTTETSNLATMGQALVAEIVHTDQIPGASTWASSLGSWLLTPPQSITNNACGYQRIYLYDTSGFGSITLPYTQTTGATTYPSNPRLMIVSSLDGNLPDVSGGTNSTEFSAVWNTTAGNIPSTWTAWATNHHASGSRLLIQRVNLLPLFKQVILSAVDTNAFGAFVVQSGLPAYTTAANYVLTNAPNNCWYLQGTVIGFYDTNYNAALGNCNLNLESQYVVQNNISFVYEDAAWRGLLTGWGPFGPAVSFVTPMQITLTNYDSVTNTIVITTTTTTFTTNYVNTVALAQNYTTTCHSFTGCGNNSHNSYHPTDCGQSCQSCCDNFMSDYNSWQNQGCAGGCTYNNICNDCKSLCDMCGNLSQ